MSNIRYCTPRDTGAALGNSYPLSCDNFGLLLSRYVPFEAIRNDDIQDDRGRKRDTVRGDWLRKVCAETTPTAVQRALQEAMLARWEAQTTGAECFQMIARGRLIVGLGGKGVLEIGLTLHHTTGLPHIPGSALKGLARSFALFTIAQTDEVFTTAPSLDTGSKRLVELDELLQAGKYQHELADIYRIVFGTQDAAGACVFYDGVLSSIPPNKPLFKVDVMTPHFSEYYRSSGRSAPHDGDSPNPVNFITVTEGVMFNFAVGVRPGFPDATICKPARAWLRAGLREMGIGAKTAAGYGVFAPPPKKK